MLRLGIIGAGGIASLLDIYLVLCVLWALIVITGGNLTVLNDIDPVLLGSVGLRPGFCPTRGDSRLTVVPVNLKIRASSRAAI